MDRPPPRDIKHEPPYPDHATVLFCLDAPNWTAHRVTIFCAIEEPHPIAVCREWVTDPLSTRAWNCLRP